MEICTVEKHLGIGITVLALPAKLLIRSPLAPDCDFELRVERELTSEEWDCLESYIAILRSPADRARNKVNDSIPE